MIASFELIEDTYNYRWNMTGYIGDDKYFVEAESIADCLIELAVSIKIKEKYEQTKN
jgi:hypothetical protein